LVQHAEVLASRAQIWIVNPQDAESTARFKAKHRAPFLFLVDEELRVIKQYGVYHTLHPAHGHIPYPTTFSIKPDGTVSWRFLGLQPRDRPRVEQILSVLDKLGAGF
jgi:peroxiredoxin